MISFNKVTKQYKLDEKSTIMPVRNVTLNIKKGDLIIIIGRSGSGKTTLLNIAAGLVKPSSGDILIDGTNLCNMNDKELSRMRSQKIGFVFQFPSLLPSLTVLENIAMPTIFAGRQSKKDSFIRAAKLVKMMGLNERIDAYPKQLSGGEQKRVVIARSLINQPEILLADEPTADLDELTEQEIMSLLQEINDTGVTFFMVTHSLQLLPYATKAYKMENGILSEVASVKELAGTLVQTGKGASIYSEK